MQDTRQRILEYLKINGEATVEELRDWLDGITAVTVRHHLDVLRREELVDTPNVQRRETPGRPRYVYMLTKKAARHFPKNYRNLTEHLLEEISEKMGAREASALFKNVGKRMAEGGPTRREGEPFKTRLQNAVEFLSEQGYVARYEATDSGFLLCLSNCPYGCTEASDEHLLCTMDASLIAALLDIAPRRVNQMTRGDKDCSYFVPTPD